MHFPVLWCNYLEENQFSFIASSEKVIPHQYLKCSLAQHSEMTAMSSKLSYDTIMKIFSEVPCRIFVLDLAPVLRKEVT